MDIERKLKNFTKMAENEAEKTYQDLIRKTDSHIKASLEKTKKEALEAAEGALESELSILKQMQKREISRYEREIRKKLLLRREEILKELKMRVEKSLLEYTGSSEYYTWLCESIKDEKVKNPGATIILNTKDYENLGFMTNAVSSKEIYLGGYKLILNDGKRLIDNTFGARLLEQLENFQGFTPIDINIEAGL